VPSQKGPNISIVFRCLRELRAAAGFSSLRRRLGSTRIRAKANSAPPAAEELLNQDSDTRRRSKDLRGELRSLKRSKQRQERIESRKARQLKRAKQIDVWKQERAERKQQRAVRAASRRLAQEQEKKARHDAKVAAIRSHFQKLTREQLIELCAGLHFVESADLPEQLVVDLLYSEVGRRGITQDSIQLAILQIQQAALLESLDAIGEQNSKSRWGFGIGFGI